MTTDWKWRVFLFVREADNTADTRQTLAAVYTTNGSGETLQDELKMFDNVVQLSTTGQLPAQAFGVNTAAKTSMRDRFKTVLDGLTNARYAAVANTTLPNWVDGELALTNFSVTPSGQIIGWQDALQYLENEFGLRVIPQ